ncbi:TadE family type IV pilus minor pilin [Aeromicrobium sp. CF4.19]|uniref:TadE family type IV pilus minor pilin n=1 Tax=Aeromicrobium sp. CF4.19 TaxID=3373082 RepID=UPI003EE70E85
MRRERGMVTAELATIAPFGVALALLLLWIVSLGVTQVRLVDASREAARLVARGETVESATATARRLAPAGAAVVVERKDGLVEVRIEASSRLPLPGLREVGSHRLSSAAVAADEAP